MRIFLQHTHIDGFHDPQLTPTLKPNKITLRRTYMNTANRPYWQVKTICVRLMWRLIVSQSWTLWMSPNQTGLKKLWSGLGPQCHRPVHTLWPAKKLRLLSVRACQRDWEPPVCDWWPGFCIFLKLTRVGSAGWESSLFYLVNIILIISLTNPAVECMHVCACAHVRTQGGVFPCPQLSRYV